MTSIGLQSVDKTVVIDPPRDYRGNGSDVWVVSADAGRTITAPVAEPAFASTGADAAVCAVSAHRRIRNALIGVQRRTIVE